MNIFKEIGIKCLPLKTSQWTKTAFYICDILFYPDMAMSYDCCCSAAVMETIKNNLTAQKLKFWGSLE